jgi:hypothetical protein
MLIVPDECGMFNILLGQRVETFLLDMKYFIEGWINCIYCLDIYGDDQLNVPITNNDNTFFPFIKD